MLRHWSQFVPNMSTDVRGLKLYIILLLPDGRPGMSEPPPHPPTRLESQGCHLVLFPISSLLFCLVLFTLYVSSLSCQCSFS